MLGSLFSKLLGATSEQTETESEVQGVPEGFIDIPRRPFDLASGDFHHAWGPLLELSNASFPVFLNLSALPGVDEARPLRASDLQQQVLYVQCYNASGALEPYNVFYSDTRLLKPGTMLQQMQPRAYLEHVLYDPNSVGVAFNPPSRVTCRLPEEDTFYMNKSGIAELVGFLDVGANEPQEQLYCDLACEAFGRDRYFEVLYYWAKSYRCPREGDDWRACYMEKLKSYHALDFPGSRERARAELSWFMREFGATPEHSVLLESWSIG